MIVIYVDDLLIASTDLSIINWIKDILKGKFKMKDLGNIKDILGIEVEREGNVGNIKISQRWYVQYILTLCTRGLRRSHLKFVFKLEGSATDTMQIIFILSFFVFLYITAFVFIKNLKNNKI